MIVYKITNLLNGKIYVGQTIFSLRKRMWNHRSCKNTLIASKLKEYGEENFKIEVIDEAKNINCLNKKEIFWIKYFDCVVPKGYNITLGGKGTLGNVLSKETKEKISKKAKGRIGHNKGKKLSEETRNKISLSRIGKYGGENNPNYGKIHSEETRKKISIAKTGKKLSEQSRKNISEGHKGIKKTLEQRKAMSDNCKHKIKVLNVQTGEKFDSLKAVNEKYGIDISVLSKVVRGIRNHKLGGYNWKAVE